MDPLSDVLSLLKPRSYKCGGFDVGGALSVQFERHDGIKCYSMVSGQCWLQMEGVPEPVLIRTGDCFLLPHGRPFRLATDLALPSIDAYTIFAKSKEGSIHTWNGGGACCIVGSFFALSGSHAGMLLGVLPPIVHIRGESDKAAMRWSIDRMRQELREPQPGGFLVAQQLATMMLVQALRLHLAEGAEAARDRVGWIFALADQQMSAAIHAIHGEPGRPWSVQELAEQAGMSRSIFALKFKQAVGSSPMEYLTRWRMLLAGDRLTGSREPVSAIALSLGYESESAFSTAFKRVMGCSPRQYSRGRSGPPALANEAESIPTEDLELVAG